MNTEQWIELFRTIGLDKETKMIQSLSINLRSHGCKKFSGQEKYRVRKGNYRIIYSIEDDILIVYVVKIGHRKDIYKRLS